MAKGDVIQDRDLIERIDKALANNKTTAEELYLLAKEAFEKCIIIGESRRYNTMYDPKGHLWASLEARKRAKAVESLYHPIWEYARKDFFYSDDNYYIKEFRPVLAEFSKNTKHLWELGEAAADALRPKEKLENGYKMFMEGWSEEEIREWDEDELREMYEDTFCEEYVKKEVTPYEQSPSDPPKEKSHQQKPFEVFDARPKPLDSPPKAFPSPKSKKQQWKFPFGIFKKKR